MNLRLCLVKAQEADAIANAAESPINRRTWENIAEQWRELAREIEDQQSVAVDTR